MSGLLKAVADHIAAGFTQYTGYADGARPGRVLRRTIRTKYDGVIAKRGDAVILVGEPVDLGRDGLWQPVYTGRGTLTIATLVPIEDVEEVKGE